MKKILLVGMVVALLFSVQAQTKAVAFLGADLCFLDVLYSDTLQARFDLGIRLSPEFSFRAPVNIVSDRVYSNVSLWETGLFLDYHPFESGLFFSVSLVQLALFSGEDRPLESSLYLNEMALGYTYHLWDHWFIEPKLIIRDPSGVFQNEYEQVEQILVEYAQFRFSLTFGWDFLAIPNPREKKEACEGQEGGEV
ncbi:MAG: hypothetical protein PHO09_09430 [Sphaerochaeta sp.]|nr:hypothetical protein [Sphaerochaeta sp.]